MKWVLEQDRFLLREVEGFEAMTATRSVPLSSGALQVRDLRQPVERMVRRPAAVVGMEQVHGKSVRVVAEGKDAIVPACDGLVTDQPGVVLTMRSADCLPLIALDPVRRVVGLAHAGWRGIRSGIPGQLVDVFLSRFRSAAGDIQIAIGPGIGPCCYEVGPEFEEWFSSQMEIRNERRFLDLKKAAVARLIRAGLSSAQIVSSPWCSSCERELCFSYRRDGAETGRMMTCAMILSSS